MLTITYSFCGCLLRNYIKIFLTLLSASILLFLADSFIQSGIITQLIPSALNSQEAVTNIETLTTATTAVTLTSPATVDLSLRPGKKSTNHVATLKSQTSLSQTQDGEWDSDFSCPSSPFIICNRSVSTQPMANETFNVALLRKPSWMFHGKFDFSKCHYSNCVYQGPKVNESTKVVVVVVVGLNDHYRPPKRWPHQLYLAASWESPVMTFASFLTDNNSMWNTAFNLTATYRVDSDIFSPYGRLIYRPKPPEKRPNYLEITKKKTKMAVWFVSHCEAASGRDEYVKQMQKVIDVDVYGGCGKPCPESGTKCSTDIPVNYRYYLSFENLLCEDYVTEKFFKIFKENFHMIPVVRGSFNYVKYLPRKTFINAANFKSAAELAYYLKQLANDTTEYSNYLAHQDSYRYAYAGQLGCDLCEFLNTRKIEPKIYNMKKWMGDNHCHFPNDL